MAEEKLRLRVKSERLGTISQVTELLIDFENLYNSLVVFDLFVESVRRIERQDVENFEHELRRLEKNWLRFEKRMEFNPELRYLFRELFEDRLLTRRTLVIKDETYKLLKETEITRLILPEDRLIITKVNIQSPGFWEFLGNLNPLQQIREYLKDCHERKKDNAYRNRQEEIKAEQEIEEKEIEIIQKKIEILKNLGYNEMQIRDIIAKLINDPIKKLNKHLASGQIEGIEQ